MASWVRTVTNRPQPPQRHSDPCLIQHQNSDPGYPGPQYWLPPRRRTKQWLPALLPPAPTPTSAPVHPAHARHSDSGYCSPQYWLPRRKRTKQWLSPEPPPPPPPTPVHPVHAGRPTPSPIHVHPGKPTTIDQRLCGCWQDPWRDFFRVQHLKGVCKTTEDESAGRGVKRDSKTSQEDGMERDSKTSLGDGVANVARGAKSAVENGVKSGVKVKKDRGSESLKRIEKAEVSVTNQDAGARNLNEGPKKDGWMKTMGQGTKNADAVAKNAESTLKTADKSTQTADDLLKTADTFPKLRHADSGGDASPRMRFQESVRRLLDSAQEGECRRTYSFGSEKPRDHTDSVCEGRTGLTMFSDGGMAAYRLKAKEIDEYERQLIRGRSRERKDAGSADRSRHRSSERYQSLSPKTSEHRDFRELDFRDMDNNRSLDGEMEPFPQLKLEPHEIAKDSLLEVPELGLTGSTYSTYSTASAPPTPPFTPTRRSSTPITVIHLRSSSHSSVRCPLDHEEEKHEEHCTHNNAILGIREEKKLMPDDAPVFLVGNRRGGRWDQALWDVEEMDEELDPLDDGKKRVCKWHYDEAIDGLSGNPGRWGRR